MGNTNGCVFEGDIYGFLLVFPLIIVTFAFGNFCKQMSYGCLKLV